MPRPVDLIEPALSLARERLGPPVLDCAGAHDALRAVRHFVELYRPAAYEEYGVGRVMDSALRGSAQGVRAPDALDSRMCVGDSVQVQTLVQALVRNVELGAEAELSCVVEMDGDVACVQIAIDGPGHFSDTVDLGYGITIPFETVQEMWTIATKGGRIDRSPTTLSLRLKGIRVLPESRTDLAAWSGWVTEAEAKLRVLTGGGGGDGHERLRSEALRAVNEALARIDAVRKPPEPCDLRALITEALEASSGELTEAGIVQDAVLSDALPPIVLRRNHLASALWQTAQLALASMRSGGTYTVLADYLRDARKAEVVVALGGRMRDSAGLPYLASIRRTIEDLHGGRFEALAEDRALTMHIELADTVGACLDEWLPGFERFSERSKQMLRLLKSGGPAPPEEFILAGVLEEELERWLLPRLSAAPATTMAHELDAEKSPLPGSIAERRAKALAQIARGRPKKEVCQPAYAAEVLWAYRIDERHRRAIDAHRLSESVLKALCEEMLKAQIDYASVLRMVASGLT